MTEEFNPECIVVDCDAFGCDLYKFNGQAPCFTGECLCKEKLND